MRNEQEVDRELSAHFTALRGDVAAAVPLPSEELIVVRGTRRRRTGQVLLAALAVLGLAGIGAALVNPSRSPGHEESLTVSARAHYAPPAGAVREPIGLRIPVGFLPGDTNPYARGDADVALREQCPGGRPFATNAEILARRQIVEPGAQWDTTLLVYGHGMTASRAFDEYRAEALRCAAAGVTGAFTAVAEDLSGFGAQAVRARRTFRPGAAVSPPVSVAVRYGGSLLILDGSDPEQVLAGAGQLERRLCVFAANCAARGGRPPALVGLTAGGRATAVVLAVENEPDVRALGSAIAAASEAGYRATVSSVDCDRGAREGLGLADEPQYYYVAVYFAAESEAKVFAAAAPTRVVATIPVRTYCIT